MTDDEKMAEAWQQYGDYKAEIARKCERLLKVILRIKGSWFHSELLELMGDDATGEVEIVTSPNGNKQVDCDYPELGRHWVDQWQTGPEGDSYAGYVYVLLRKEHFDRKAKYLKFRFEC